MVQVHVDQVRVSMRRVAEAHAAHDAEHRQAAAALHRDGTLSAVDIEPDQKPAPKRKG